MTNSEPVELTSLAPEKARHFWDLMVQRGHTPTEFRLTLVCRLRDDANRVAERYRDRKYDPITIREAPPYLEVVGHTRIAILTEDYVVELHAFIVSILKDCCNCGFRGLSAQ